MKINVKAQQIELTPAIASYLEKRLLGVKKFLGVIEDAAIAQVELGKTTRHHKAGDFFKCEVHLRAWGKVFSASATESDLYAAIDKMKDELVQELTAHKGKKISVERKGSRQIKDLLHHVRTIRGEREAD
ncbi:MAG: ribosomal subunit interface protein [Parcubacteria group bacterium RIFOXYD2_FULL_52_8]|nr:MAG: ribosomal subunit interface protein [Parcubacteria group bacterium RIFOXYD2_FULL_52_8]